MLLRCINRERGILLDVSSLYASLRDSAYGNRELSQVTSTKRPQGGSRMSDVFRFLKFSGRMRVLPFWGWWLGAWLLLGVLPLGE